MVRALNRRIWIFLPLIMAGLVPALFPGIVQSAMLKDIRVGEYEGFTRIVFELDARNKPGEIHATNSGRLTVLFADTSAAFTRRIPVERSQQIKKIQIWQRNNDLSAVIYFNFERYRQDSFQLSDPPRLVVDIQPMQGQASQAPAIAPEEKTSDADRGAKSPEPAVHTSVSATNSMPDAEEPPPLKEVEAGASQSLPPSPKEESLQDAPIAAASQSKAIDKPVAEAPPSVDKETEASQPLPPAKGLQYYLVITLVLITIAILVLLLLMLLSKRRWVEDTSQLNNSDFLQKQDKDLASLDARIQEQLERYKEA